MKVQLYVPPGGYFAERWSKGSSMPPLGILSIAAVLENNGIGVEVVPADILNLSWREIRNKIRDSRPDIVGVTATTENRFQSFRLVKIAKQAFPETLTVLGGPHASMAAADCLAHLPELDLVVRGEGENTMLELCRALGSKPGLAALEQTPGLVLRKDGRIVSTAPRPPIDDLDTLPFPAFHLVPFEKYNFTVDVPGQGPLPAVNIMASRGCPFDCNFCATPINWGRAVRMRSPENVVREIEQHIKDHGARVIFFYDDTFNCNPRRVQEICNLIIARRLDIFWRAEVRLDLISRPLLAKMKEAGLFHISFGLEAGSERVRNEIIDKKINIQDFHNLVGWCHELGIIPNVFFIFSHPTETWEEALETVEIIERYRGSIESTIAILHVYPGTPLEKTAKKTGVLPKDFTWTKKYRTKITTLPLAQGDVPLFLDRLTWAQVSELLFRWSESRGGGSVIKKIPKALGQIRSWGDLKRYLIMGFVYLKIKIVRGKVS
jgi:anaerobic magnesium-protoporphyrin IX monomethyl ester cyclase